MNIALIGYGKMGKAVAIFAQERGHKIATIIQKTTELPQLTEHKIDVAIEFTRPEVATQNIAYCIKNKIPIVVGTTGWQKHLFYVEELVKTHKGSLLYSSNFSIGMNIFFEINRQLAKLMNTQKSYRPSISETHHIQKRDAPSGTAISLAHDVIEQHSHLNDWHLVTDPSTTNGDLLPISAIREGEVPGTHSVAYHSTEDSIIIEHRAHNRNGFALGAILSAEFLYGKFGIFTMKDLMRNEAKQI